MEVDEKWQQLLIKLNQGVGRRVIYVIGSNDSGKSTFCKFIIDNLSKDFRAAYIDCDPGQSTIGLPTTIGLTIPFLTGENEQTNYQYFIGSTTPRGHLLPTLTGMKKLTEKAIRCGAQRIILDSCGFILDKPARVFQFHAIDLLQPDYLIIFQRSYEYLWWTNDFKRNPRIRLYRFPVSPAVNPRTPEERRSYREEKFKNHFKFAAQQKFCWRGIGFHGRIPDLRDAEKYRNLLIALCDAENFVITLGIVHEIDLANKILDLYSPQFNHTKVAFIHFGSIYLDNEILAFNQF
jgi:polynucleotide 5'-hydroxyl-kinase GRC3/NOL9